MLYDYKMFFFQILVVKEEYNMAKNKEYKAGTYIKKKPRKKKNGPMCPVCASCEDRKLCKNRKDKKLMLKCPECKECADAENCDIFYISEEHKIVIPIGRDEDTGKIIRKSFSGKTEAEAIYKSVQYQKEVEAGNIEPTIRKKYIVLYLYFKNI